MAKILVSSCLLGCPCRYDSKSCGNEAVIALAKHHVLIPICPEQMGGLTTPRRPSEIVGDKLLNNAGEDVTKQYNAGAAMALSLAQINGCTIALLKAKSPSCGKGKIYDGTFSGTLIDGNGVTVKLLEENGIKVFADTEIEELLKCLE